MYKYFVFLFFLLTLPLVVTAQSTLQYKAGLAVPIFQFGDQDYSNSQAAGAGLGALVGIEYQKPLKFENLSLAVGASFMFHPLSKDFRLSLENDYSAESEFQFWNYINLPVHAGLNYTHKLKDNKALEFQAGGSFNVFKITNFVWKEAGDEDLVSQFDPATAIGVYGSLLYWVDPKSAVQLSYRNLGDFNVGGHYDYGTTSGNLEVFRRNVSVICLEYVFRF